MFIRNVRLVLNWILRWPPLQNTARDQKGNLWQSCLSLSIMYEKAMSSYLQPTNLSPLTKSHINWMSRFKFSAANCRCQKKTGIEWYQIQPSLNRPQKLQLNYYAWKMGVLRSQWIYYLGNPSNFFILLFALLFTFSLFMHNFLTIPNTISSLDNIWQTFSFETHIACGQSLLCTRPWLNANKTC